MVTKTNRPSFHSSRKSAPQTKWISQRQRALPSTDNLLLVRDSAIFRWEWSSVFSIFIAKLSEMIRKDCWCASVWREGNGKEKETSGGRKRVCQRWITPRYALGHPFWIPGATCGGYSFYERSQTKWWFERLIDWSIGRWDILGITLIIFLCDSFLWMDDWTPTNVTHH